MDGPPAGGTCKLLFPDPDGVTAGFTKIIDHDSAAFSLRSGVHPHPLTNLDWICGNVVIVWLLGHAQSLDSSCVKDVDIDDHALQNSGASRGGPNFLPRMSATSVHIRCRGYAERDNRWRAQRRRHGTADYILKLPSICQHPAPRAL
jgi:hypothetical protein